MDPTDTNPEVDVDKAFAERLALLPPVVQQAIQSADLEKHLRALADSHKLHLDQWELLQNEVKLALLGFEDADKLPENLENEVGVDTATAADLSKAINDEIFEPIRQELERALVHPEAKDAQVDDMEKARLAAISLAKAAGEDVPPVRTVVQPATPPTPAPEGKAIRAPISESYKPSVPSTARKAVDGDPYREPPL
jgi:hypothetical protein